VKSTFVGVVPLVDEAEVGDEDEPLPVVDSLVVVDLVDFGEFAFVVLGPSVVLLDGPCASPEFPCVDEEPCDAVCADGPWFPELPCCAYAGRTVNDTTAITPAETLTSRIA